MLSTNTTQYPKQQSMLIMDDQELFRAGIRRMIDEIGCCSLVFEASTSEEGIEIVKTQEIDMVFIDTALPDLDGISTAMLLREIESTLRIVLLTGSGAVHHALPAAGLSGYLTKSSRSSEVAEVIEAVYRGDVYFSRDLGHDSHDTDVVPGSGFDQLSQRELQVIVLLAQGYKTAVAGRLLHLDARTISTYKRRGFEKLGISNTSELVRLALDCGVLATS